MEGNNPAAKRSCMDSVFTFVGLLFFLADIALDVWAVVDFYQEEDYVHLGLLLLFLLGSSALAQVYSWLWYKYDGFESQTRVGNCLKPCSLTVLHVFLFGVYFRYAGILEVTILPDPQNAAAFLTHDLRMLRLIETFTESAPQLVLMLTVILQRDLLDHVTVLKAVGSASAIAVSVTMYHRSLRSFLPDKDQQMLSSTLIYFLWNLLLIASRLVAITLFASVLPCYIFTHFICSWMVLFFCAWRMNTSFMDSAGGEWLYRATVGIIWYFSWFNVAEGPTWFKSLIYHIYIIVDMCFLCGMWYWQINCDAPYLEITPLYAAIISVVVVVIYIVGLVIKGIYYKWCHPKIKKIVKDEEKGSVKGDGFTTDGLEPDSEVVMFRSMLPSPPEPEPVQRENKRMRKLAESFYS
ncbi:XK-related protein 8-like [Diretmus argenteus]